MVFQWDPNKAEANRKKHGIDFQEAATVLDDTLSSTFPDPDHSGIGEPRFLTIGHSERGRIIVVAHAERDDLIRIICSPRHPHREEVL